jgi:hypothetical protein
MTATPANKPYRLTSGQPATCRAFATLQEAKKAGGGYLWRLDKDGEVLIFTTEDFWEHAEPYLAAFLLESAQG